MFKLDMQILRAVYGMRKTWESDNRWSTSWLVPQFMSLLSQNTVCSVEIYSSG